MRGPGSYDTAMRALENLAAAGFGQPKISVVMTRQNVDQLDEFKAIADKFGAQLRITRLRPSGRGADVWDELHPTAAQQRQLYDWLVARGEDVLTGDSFFHLSAYGEALPGLNLCGAGRVVCLIDPVGDVYACPFAIHEQFLAGNVRSPGGFQEVWQHSELFLELRQPQTGGACRSCLHYDSCQGGCMAAKFFTGLPLDGPGPGVRARVRRAGPRRPGRCRAAAEIGCGPLPLGAPQLTGSGSGDDRHRPARPGVRNQPDRRARRVRDRLGSAEPGSMNRRITRSQRVLTSPCPAWRVLSALVMSRAPIRPFPARPDAVS